MKPQEFESLQTQRLDLKPLVATFDFANEIFDIIDKNREYFKFMPWSDIKQPEQEFDFLRGAEKGWKNQTEAIYGLYLRKTGDFVGTCSFMSISWSHERGEIGYWLNPKFARQGFMSEAVKAIEQEFSKLGFKRIIIRANVKNIASCGVAEKCGFEREGILRSWVFNKLLNEREDMALYAKINEK